MVETETESFEISQKQKKKMITVPHQLKDVQLVGHKGVLIKLYPFKSVITKRESGLEDALYEAHYTEGGKPASSLSSKKYQPVGVVIGISPQSKKYIKDTWEGIDLTPGRVVWVTQHSVSKENEFLIERDKAVTGDKGFISVHPNSIEAVEETQIIPIEYNTHDQE